MKRRLFPVALSLLLTLIFILGGCFLFPEESFDLSSVPEFTNKAYVAINKNVPSFTEKDYTTTSYETYAPLDALGRCGTAMACVGIDLMPTEDRGEINSVTPSGWEQARYDTDLVENGWLYNRCHLIGFQLTGENANEKNLITGTRYLNIEGMLPFENMIADYVKETENHVLYRVTPIFKGNNLLPSGVHMEAYSVEDNGKGISFNVYAYNVQPGISIDYATGRNQLASDGSFVPAPVVNATYTRVTELSVNTEYYILGQNANGNLLFSGSVSSGRADGTENFGSAVAVKLEAGAAENEYYITYISGGSKQYLIAKESKAAGFDTSASKTDNGLWIIDTEEGTIISKSFPNRGIATDNSSSYKNFSTYATQNFSQQKYTAAWFVTATVIE